MAACHHLKNESSSFLLPSTSHPSVLSKLLYQGNMVRIGGKAIEMNAFIACEIQAVLQLQEGLSTATRCLLGNGAGSSRSTSVFPHLGQLGCDLESITYIKQLLHPTVTITEFTPLSCFPNKTWLFASWSLHSRGCCTSSSSPECNITKTSQHLGNFAHLFPHKCEEKEQWKGSMRTDRFKQVPW